MATLNRQRRTISQPADGTDFTVTLSPTQPDDDYGVFCEQVAGSSIGEVMLPDEIGSDRTTTQFRVVTPIALPDGAVLEFIVVHS